MEGGTTMPDIITIKNAITPILNLSVDVVTTSGIEETFQNEIKGTEVLLYEKNMR